MPVYRDIMSRDHWHMKNLQEREKVKGKHGNANCKIKIQSSPVRLKHGSKLKEGLANNSLRIRTPRPQENE